MFRQLKDEIKILNANVADFATQEKAKVLRKKLIITGAVLAAVGFIGVFVCFVLFVTAGSSAFATDGFSARIIVPFVLILPFGFMASIGVTLLKLGLSILIGGVTAKFVDKSISERCECGNTITSDELFCSKCGKSVRKTCPKCGEINDLSSQYCVKCGERL